MLDHLKNVLRNREHAIRLLYDELSSYKGSGEAVIVVIPPGGVPIGKILAARLHVPLDVLGLHGIKDPAHSDKTIGMVTADHVELQENAVNIPSQYIYNQILQLKRRIELENKFYSSIFPKQDLQGKVVILTDMFISDTDRISACIASIKKHNPAKIIVISVFTTLIVSLHLMHEGIEFHFLNMVTKQHQKDVHELCDDIGEEFLDFGYSGHLYH